ncbi:MAG: hypothetical protein ACHQT6_00390 [Candidatus Acidiferrales bacterium]
MDQEWFEMADVRRRKLDGAVWIPLRARQDLQATGRRGHLGYRSEFFGVGSLAVPLKNRAAASGLGWTRIGLAHSHRGYIQRGRYVPADVYEGYGPRLNAMALVLVQEGNSDDPQEWHLHQDFVITLRLKRERDVWLSMDEGYIEVARLSTHEGNPALLEVRAEHLKDYLCARRMALHVSSYRSRDEVVAEPSHINWPKSPFQQLSDGDRWEGRTIEINEGDLLGSWSVMHVARKNVDFQEDVPHIGPSDEVVTDSWTVQPKGQKLVQVRGELWRDEWVEPAKRSPRVRDDKLPSSTFFITDPEGTRTSGDDLEGTGGWLWFRPEVMIPLSHRRGGGLQWYTRDTGGVRCSPSTSYVHFGVNNLGLVNVYAKDVGILPEWIKVIWAGFNVSPEGGVSAELLAAQAEGNPADTQAPEEYLLKIFPLLNKITTEQFGFALFRAHERFLPLISEAHRFRSTDQGSFFALAKDLARLTADAIDIAAIQKMVTPTKGEKWRSLKSLEKLIALKRDPGRAHILLGPLFGIYELRHADAHLASSDMKEALTLVNVDQNAPFVIQGYQLLHSCVTSLYSIAKELDQFPDRAP